VRKRSDVKVLQQQDIDDLQIEEVGEDGQRHYTRRGTALKLDASGTPLWFVSLHLKSSCSTTKKVDQSIQSDCTIFWQQRLPFKEFIDQRVTDGTAFILAGDFNRQFRRFDFKDPMWKFLNGGDLEKPRLIAHPKTGTRMCPTRLEASTQPIDWIVLDSKISQWFWEGSYWETRYSFEDVRAAGGPRSRRLSDHCPIHMDVAMP
jgi:endonuclease/exonuclease/phosphatase family metal-dependent hydrolase